MESNRLFLRDKLGVIGRWWLSIDSTLFLMILLLMAIGLIAVISAGPVVADKIGIGRFIFIYKQIFFAILALLTMVFLSSIDLPYIKFLSMAGLAVSMLLLTLLPIIGDATKGAKRWIPIFGFSLQPSEFTKTFFIVFNAWLFAHINLPAGLRRYNNAEIYYISAIILGIIVLYLVEQPDYGMVIIMLTLYFAQVFLIGINIWIVVGGVASMFMIMLIAYFSVSHVHDRIFSFINTLKDSQLASYQVRKSLESLRNGLWFGTGPGEGVVKYNLPDCHTDFVFPVLAEELGILFCIVLLCLYTYIIVHVCRKLFKESDLFICLAVFGLILQFTLQVVINIGVTINLLPTKGLTLPFLSYGGSSMLNMGMCFGFILGLTKKHFGNQENIVDIHTEIAGQAVQPRLL